MLVSVIINCNLAVLPVYLPSGLTSVVIIRMPEYTEGVIPGERDDSHLSDGQNNTRSKLATTHNAYDTHTNTQIYIYIYISCNSPIVLH